jgi:hypothetical protein
VLVAGSAVFKGGAYAANIRRDSEGWREAAIGQVGLLRKEASMLPRYSRPRPSGTGR